VKKTDMVQQTTSDAASNRQYVTPFGSQTLLAATFVAPPHNP
jgi:hypothetical protein